MDQPSFFLCIDLKSGGGGFLPGNGPSSLSGFAGIASALPGEDGLFLNDGTHLSNSSDPSSTAGIRRNASRTSGTGSQPTNNMTSSLQTVRSHDKK